MPARRYTVFMARSRQLRPPTFDPPLDRWPPAGVYQLRLRVSVGLHLTIGRLGRFWFPPGRYVYTGRAARGLAARVQRHVDLCCGRGVWRQHWHIDYLLAHPAVRLERVTVASKDPAAECLVSQSVAGDAIAPGFGASDCRRGCRTHLWRVPRAARGQRAAHP